MSSGSVCQGCAETNSSCPRPKTLVTGDTRNLTFGKPSRCAGLTKLWGRHAELQATPCSIVPSMAYSPKLPPRYRRKLPTKWMIPCEERAPPMFAQQRIDSVRRSRSRGRFIQKDATARPRPEPAPRRMPTFDLFSGDLLARRRAIPTNYVDQRRPRR